MRIEYMDHVNVYVHHLLFPQQIRAIVTRLVECMADVTLTLNQHQVRVSSHTG